MTGVAIAELSVYSQVWTSAVLLYKWKRCNYPDRRIVGLGFPEEAAVGEHSRATAVWRYQTGTGLPNHSQRSVSRKALSCGPRCLGTITRSASYLPKISPKPVFAPSTYIADDGESLRTISSQLFP